MLLKFFWCLNIIYCSNYERRVPCGGDHGSEWVMMPEHQGEEDSCYAVYITWSDVGYAARSWHDAEAKCLEKVALTNTTALSPSNALVMQPGPDMMLRPGLGTPFFFVWYVTFFSVLKRERYILFRSFLEFLATYETQKNVPFFLKERKRMQRMFRSF